MIAFCDAHVLLQFGDYVGLTSSEGTLESVSKPRQTNRQQQKIHLFYKQDIFS